MVDTSPQILVIAGPNGAGKSTVAPLLLQHVVGIAHFVNADQIAQGLSAFDPESVAIQAGRLMLDRLEKLAQARESFAFETTLASRTFAPWIAELIQQGYRFRLVYLWLPSSDAAVNRVARRVSEGGHSVPDDTVHRRYVRGLKNLFALYMPLADDWRVYNSSDSPALLATGSRAELTWVADPSLWNQIRNTYATHKS